MAMDSKKKVPADVLQVALLDEIAERLLSIEKLTKATEPEGVVEPFEKMTITNQRFHLKLRKPLFSCSIINDGPDSVFVIVNVEKSLEEHRILDHETYNVNFGRALITGVLFWCQPGETAAIRMVGTR